MLADSDLAVQPPGNRCGHNPQVPRWFEPPECHKARPGILRKLGEKIRAYYDTPAKILPSLNLANGAVEAKTKQITTQSKQSSPNVAVNTKEPLPVRQAGLSVIAHLKGMLKGTGPP